MPDDPLAPPGIPASNSEPTSGRGVGCSKSVELQSEVVGGNSLSSSRELVIAAVDVTLPDASADIPPPPHRPHRSWSVAGCQGAPSRSLTCAADRRA